MTTTPCQSTNSQYDLPWISFAKLCGLVEHAFKNVVKKIKKPDTSPNEPTLVAAYASLTNSDVQETLHVLDQVSLVKSIQNAVGTLHQKILGSVDGWKDSGQRGGGYDIRSVGPVGAAGNRVVLMEIKMRWNTIKASDEKRIHDLLADAVKSNWGGEYPVVGYLAQIVPKKQETYDREWKVTQRIPVENVRSMDGRTAYHMVTGYPNALEDVLKVLPYAFAEVFSKKNIDFLDFSNDIDVRMLTESIKLAIPENSAFE